MKKRNAIISLIAICALIAALVYVVLNGIGIDKTGSAQGIDLDLTLQVV